MQKKIDVLDYGFVRLVDSMGSDLSVVRAARVSYNEEWRAGEDEGSDARLIKYLKKNKHHTPFEAAITVRILLYHEALLDRGQIDRVKPGTVLGDGVVYDEQLYAQFKPRPHIVVTNPTPTSKE